MLLVDPVKIEKESFRLIGEALGSHNFSRDELYLVKRVIHATADMEYKNLLVLKSDPIHAGIKAISSGCNILVDVNMVKAGINKELAGYFGCCIMSFIDDPSIKKEAKIEGITRNIIAIRKGASFANNGIVLIGNAPTALMEIVRLIREKKVEPALVVGVPVGFVGAEEVKEELIKLDIPLIISRGKKGGSPVASAIINALLKIAANKS